MKKRKIKGTFWKVNGPAIDNLFDWFGWNTGTEFIPGRLRMVERARKVVNKSR